MNVVAPITAIAGRARTGAAHGRVVVPAHGHAVRGVRTVLNPQKRRVAAWRRAAAATGSVRYFP
jgi:hypothetical protein